MDHSLQIKLNLKIEMIKGSAFVPPGKSADKYLSAKYLIKRKERIKWD
jgi:hypothetical protein